MSDPSDQPGAADEPTQVERDLEEVTILLVEDDPRAAKWVRLALEERGAKLLWATRIDQARLLVLKAAHRMDREGNAAARIDVSAIKVVAARLQTRILDRAMQVFGAMGLTPDTPLSWFWTWGRALRFLDGPDEVHLRVIARSELSRAKANAGRNADYFVPPVAR